MILFSCGWLVIFGPADAFFFTSNLYVQHGLELTTLRSLNQPGFSTLALWKGLACRTARSDWDTHWQVIPKVAVRALISPFLTQEALEHHSPLPDPGPLLRDCPAPPHSLLLCHLCPEITFLLSISLTPWALGTWIAISLNHRPKVYMSWPKSHNLINLINCGLSSLGSSGHDFLHHMQDLMELIPEECIERDRKGVDQRPKKLFSSPVSGIFATNHVIICSRYKKTKSQKPKKKKGWGRKEKKRKERRTFPFVSYCKATSFVEK